jgi:3-oxoacyl-[acyl-carrier protein] reductase
MSNLTFGFHDQTIIVTGAARGIGEAVSSHFAASGASVWMIDVDESELRAAAEKIGARWLVADVGSSKEVELVIAEIAADSGRIDVLINNAGILRDRVLWKLSDEDWEAVLRVHLGGMFRFTRACVPFFRQRNYGRIVNVTSYTGLHGNIGQSAYGAAKAGVIGFTKTAAKELAPFGVTVNAISPNAESRMISSIPDEKRKELIAQIPLGRFADPAEIAVAVAFLASMEANYITGAVLPIDGGLSM